MKRVVQECNTCGHSYHDSRVMCNFCALVDDQLSNWCPVGCLGVWKEEAA